MKINLKEVFGMLLGGRCPA